MPEHPLTIDAGTGTVAQTNASGFILPTRKAPAIERALEGLSGGVRRTENRCATCHDETGHYDDFRDAISRVEFAISRMCQRCQDEVFRA